MKKEEAIQVLVNGVSLAQQKGVYTLGDAKIIVEALQVLKPELFIQKEENVEEM